VLGITALAIIAGREWLAWANPTQQKYIAQPIVYTVGTNTDLPVLKIILAGLALWWAARRRSWKRRLGQTADGTMS
jgi:hypothetical protein